MCVRIGKKYGSPSVTIANELRKNFNVYVYIGIYISKKKKIGIYPSVYGPQDITLKKIIGTLVDVI